MAIVSVKGLPPGKKPCPSCKGTGVVNNLVPKKAVAAKKAAPVKRTASGTVTKRHRTGTGRPGPLKPQGRVTPKRGSVAEARAAAKRPLKIEAKPLARKDVTPLPKTKGRALSVVK